MQKQTKADKAIDKRIAAAYHRTCNGIQIPMMAIPAINRKVRDAMTAATTDDQLDVLVRITVEMFRTN